MSTLSVSAIQNPAAGQSNILLNADGSVTLPVITGAAAPLQFQAGTLWFDTAGPALQIRNPANTAWVALSSAQAATLAEAAAGTLTTVYSSPETTVPKDAAGMTGAALLPTGTNAQRTAITSPVAGMTRFNTDYAPDSLEVYDGASWKQLAYVSTLGPLTDYTAVNGATLPSSGTYENIIIPAGVTVNVNSVTKLTARTSITVDGTINGNGSGSQGVSGFVINTLSAGAGSLSTGGVPGIGPSPGIAGSTIDSPSTSISLFLGSSGGTGNFNVVDTSSTARSFSGASGASLILVCEGAISVGSSAVISMNGANAPASSIGGNNAAAGGGGGGSGGIILLQSQTFLAIAPGATFSCTGGNGANGLGTGPLAGSGGGGGGGGGYIVLNSPNTTDGSTKTLTGGTAGSGTPASGALGGSGGGFGGAGGAAGGLGVVSSSGSPGQTVLNSYI